MAIDAYGWFVGGKLAIKGETLDEEVKKESGFDLIDFEFSVINQVKVGSASGCLGSRKPTFEKLSMSNITD
jgi:hypothetical protein